MVARTSTGVEPVSQWPLPLQVSGCVALSLIGSAPTELTPVALGMSRLSPAHPVSPQAAGCWSGGVEVPEQAECLLLQLSHSALSAWANRHHGEIATSEG